MGVLQISHGRTNLYFNSNEKEEMLFLEKAYPELTTVVNSLRTTVLSPLITTEGLGFVFS